MEDEAHVYGERKCCPDCDHRPAAPSEPPAELPPVGPRPRWLVNEQRVTEVADAIGRYEAAGVAVPDEWHQELAALTPQPPAEAQQDDGPFSCCAHCLCPEGERTGHDATCVGGCNDAAGRAGAGEQRRERDLVARWLRIFHDGDDEWFDLPEPLRNGYRNVADELLALLGGPQADGDT
jgi:hypothetical protein